MSGYLSMGDMARIGRIQRYGPPGGYGYMAGLAGGQQQYQQAYAAAQQEVLKGISTVQSSLTSMDAAAAKLDGTLQKLQDLAAEDDTGASGDAFAAAQSAVEEVKDLVRNLDNDKATLQQLADTGKQQGGAGSPGQLALAKGMTLAKDMIDRMKVVAAKLKTVQSIVKSAASAISSSAKKRAAAQALAAAQEAALARAAEIERARQDAADARTAADAQRRSDVEQARVDAEAKRREAADVKAAELIQKQQDDVARREQAKIDADNARQAAQDAALQRAQDAASARDAAAQAREDAKQASQQAREDARLQSDQARQDAADARAAAAADRQAQLDAQRNAPAPISPTYDEGGYDETYQENTYYDDGGEPQNIPQAPIPARTLTQGRAQASMGPPPPGGSSLEFDNAFDPYKETMFGMGSWWSGGGMGAGPAPVRRRATVRNTVVRKPQVTEVPVTASGSTWKSVSRWLLISGGVLAAVGAGYAAPRLVKKLRRR